MIKSRCVTVKQYDFSFTGSPQEISLKKGRYLFELWGASGCIYHGYEINPGGCDYTTGSAGFVSGIIEFQKPQILYIYVGEEGKDNEKAIFNCQSKTGGLITGGGATDIRISTGEWNSFDSLKTRIIVAGGSGGGERACGGNAGGLEGIGNKNYYSSVMNATGGTQTSGGSPGRILTIKILSGFLEVSGKEGLEHVMVT